MSSLAFWKAVVQDKSNFLERVIALLEDSGFAYCVIGGVAVNAYAEPVVTVDLDIVLAIDDLPIARALLEEQFRVREFEHSLNVYDPDSKLQIQIQKDPDLGAILDRVRTLDVMDLNLPVAALPDLIRLKVAAALEPSRRQSKRAKDYMDLARLIGAYPEHAALIPPALTEDVNRFMDEPIL